MARLQSAVHQSPLQADDQGAIDALLRAAAKKGADAEGRWLQAKRAAVASSQEVLKKSGAGGGAGTSVGAEAWHMYVDTKSPEFRGLMTALVSLGLEFFVWSAPEADGLLFFKWTRHGPSGLPGPLVAVELLFSSSFPQLRVPQS